MHFLECLDLAQHIHRTRPSWTIIAIGRFVPPDKIKLGTPWGISVSERVGEPMRVIWSRDELDGPAEPQPAEAVNTSGFLF